MTRITRILFLACVSSVALAALFLSIHDLYWGYVYEHYRNTPRALQGLWQVFDLFRNPEGFIRCYLHQSFLRGFCNIWFLAAGLTAFSIDWKKIWTKRRDLVVATFFSDIRETIPSFKHVFGFFLSSLYCILLFGTLDSIGMASRYGLRDLAYAADGLGSYEFGEQIFSLTRDERGNTLASTSGFTGHDSDRNEIENGRLNRMVEKTYGAHSVEMARRQQILSNHLQTNFEDFVTAEKARKDAIKIYSQLGRPRERAENLAQLAYIQAELRNFDSARRSVDEALQAVSGDAGQPGERAFVALQVYPALWSMGDKERANRLLRENNYREAPVKPEQNSAMNILYAIFLLIALNFAISKTKRGLLNRLASRWTVQLNSASNNELKTYWLNKLINLELFRGGLQAADDNSKTLLRIAETS